MGAIAPQAILSISAACHQIWKSNMKSRLWLCIQPHWHRLLILTLILWIEKKGLRPIASWWVQMNIKHGCKMVMIAIFTRWCPQEMRLFCLWLLARLKSCQIGLPNINYQHLMGLIYLNGRLALIWTCWSLLNFCANIQCQAILLIARFMKSLCCAKMKGGAALY